MKKNNMKISNWVLIAAALIAAGAVMPRSAYAQNDDGIAILIQQSPVQGGTVSPEAGVHKFAIGEEVVLTAVPHPGYQFVYWIGDVGDLTANRTTVYLNSPKIIIAVFERSEFEFLVTDELTQSRPGGGLVRSPGDYGNQGFSGGGGGIPHDGHEQSSFKPQDDFPTPPNNEANDFPAPEPIPEPATILLLSLGCLGLVRKRRELTNDSL